MIDITAHIKDTIAYCRQLRTASGILVMIAIALLILCAIMIVFIGCYP